MSMGNTQSCRARKGVVLVVALALGSAGRARAATYTAIDLYTLALPAGNNSFFLGGKPQTAAPGGKVVGNGTAGNNAHALLWNGTAVATDLNPTNLGGITNSNANGTSGTQQVGYGSGTGTGNNNHALLWNGTAVATDLNPTNLGVTTSIAYGTSGTQQVGEGSGTDWRQLS